MPYNTAIPAVSMPCSYHVSCFACIDVVSFYDMYPKQVCIVHFHKNSVTQKTWKMFIVFFIMKKKKIFLKYGDSNSPLGGNTVLLIRKLNSAHGHSIAVLVHTRLLKLVLEDYHELLYWMVFKILLQSYLIMCTTQISSKHNALCKFRL